MAPIVGMVVPAVLDIINKFIPDEGAKAKAAAEAEMKILEIAAKASEGQIEINKIEAANASIFVSGWRPFIGWTCGVAFAYHYVLQPFMAFAISNYYGKMVILPAIDMEVVGYTLLGILGLGGSFRTFEKVKGVTR